MEKCENMRVEISVIIPIYNAGKYLPECLASIERQSFQAFELILVDDGSTDDSLLIAQAYADAHPNVTVISKPNEGPGMTRNRGLSLATGKYIYFLDSDDYIAEETFLQDLSDKIGNIKPDIVAFKYCEYFENTQKVRHASYDYSKISDEVSIDEKMKYMIKQDAFFCSAWSKTVKRTLLIQEHIVFDENSKCEDMDWFFSVIKKSQTMVLLDKECVVYRRRDNSVTTTAGVKNLKDYFNFFHKWSDMLLSMTEKEKAEAMCSAAGKLYFNLLILYLLCNDKAKKQLKLELKKYSYFLNYSLNPLVNKVRKFKSFFGLQGLLIALKILLILK